MQRNTLHSLAPVQKQNTDLLLLSHQCCPGCLPYSMTLLVYLKTPPILFCNTMTASYLTTNPVFRTKHVEVDYHIMREKVAYGTIITKFIPVNYQPTDIFTKTLSKALFLTNRLKLGLHDHSHLRLRGSDQC